uniref:EF-hand domain-containing protein n=1 Tax=Noctiluca scintillans TaxID=2966 RepID=A0A7S1A3Y7_NOCSC|mmetsp:Transcript_30917/g.82067  ORF Transcript_30917/g.82067 Transcript_30917/m.82067 type:complete len:247 (+) Transcript_30917:79-819(+)
MSLAALHDVPVLGHFTLAAHQNFGGLFGSTPQDEEVAFRKMDVKGTGLVAKHELATALREMGKSEREVQQLLDSFSEHELNLAQFKELVSPSPQPYFRGLDVPVVGLSVPVPNLRKAHDVPVLGAVTKGADTFTFSSVNNVTTAFGVLWGSYSEQQLRSKFNELDVEFSGTLSKEEIAKALRDTNHSEAAIGKLLSSMNKEGLNFEEFKDLVHSNMTSSDDVPGVSHARKAADTINPCSRKSPSLR